MNKLIASALGITVLTLVGAGAYSLGRHTPSATQASSPAKTERKVLYYRNPMGLPDTSPVPKKDAMGMDYVAVYDGEETPTGQISISVDKVQKLGVKSEAVALRDLESSLRVTGRIEVNERLTYTIAPKFSGWVEKLYVNTTGQSVAKGQPLFEVYSPDLAAAQREHELAVQGLMAMKDADAEAQAGMSRLVQSSRDRLRNWDISDVPSQSASGKARVIFRAPASGIVLEKKAVDGMRFMPGEVLYQIADLSSLWVIAEINEQDIAKVKVGARAKVQVDAYPGRDFAGRVDFVYPTLNSTTRTVQVRIALANTQGLLKPAMYVHAQLSTAASGKVLVVPDSAVIDSGKRQVVLVRLTDGRFESREVQLGVRSDDYVEVLEGLGEGEQVVTSANFLIDAESNLKAALGGLDHAHGGAPNGGEEKNVAPSAEHAGHGAAPVAPTELRKSVGHQAQGTLDAINADGTVSITHQAIKSLGWPGMTMDFALANPALAANITLGAPITFELVERGKGEWVITKMQAQHGGH